MSHGGGAIKEILWQGEIFIDAESEDLWEEVGFQLNLKYQICPWSFSFHLRDSEGWVGQASLSIERLRLTPLSTAPSGAHSEPENEENKLEGKPDSLAGAQNSFEPKLLKAGLQAGEPSAALGWYWPEESTRGHDGQEAKGWVVQQTETLE